ncbi:MAG: response regulator, partial [Thermodesulfobacteriota bacterium]
GERRYDYSRFGPYVCFSVTDNGVGMDEATKQRAFDPFFTTKNKERGTGLGLASVYGIVKNHNGFIEVSSQINEGTTFYVYLPASNAARQQHTSPPARKNAVRTGTETILLVDDEEMIREVGEELLAGLGHRILLADSGKQAAAIVAEKSDEIDLVILDFTMPEMGGAETFRRLKEIDPAVCVLISSGYSLNEELQNILQEGASGFIQKPFNLEQLSQKLSEIMDRCE